MSKTRFRVRLDGATRAARKGQAGVSKVDPIIQRRMEQLQDFAVQKVYRRLALRDTGALARGVQATQTGRLSFLITVEAHDPETGFNYAPITRFGHETELIVPINASVLHWFTKGDIGPKGHRFEGEEVFRPWSRGFHPDEDWVERGHPTVRTASSRIGRLIAQDIKEAVT